MQMAKAILLRMLPAQTRYIHIMEAGRRAGRIPDASEVIIEVVNLLRMRPTLRSDRVVQVIRASKIVEDPAISVQKVL
jgi:hypothetical protein